MFPNSTFPLAWLAIFTVAAGCGSVPRDSDERRSTDDASPVTAPATDLSTLEGALRTEEIRDDLTAREIQPGTWVITHEKPLPANSLVVRAADGSVLLVDTPFTPQATKALLDWIDATLEPTSKKAVNSHFHLDALGGNAALRDAGVGAQGLVTTSELLRAKGKAMRAALAATLEDPEQRGLIESVELLPPPSLYMAPRFGMPLGGERYELIFPGPGHSPDNLVVYFPDRKLLFGGCMVKGGESLGYLGDADLTSWPDAIRQLQELDVELLVPGHGTRLDPGQLEHTLELLRKAE
jgi:glyoxylase-like metal-dependent hydrolase (beta-lactamase superfamily II)